MSQRKKILPMLCNFTVSSYISYLHMRKTPMAVSDPKEVPEYKLNPGELHFSRGGDIITVQS